ncbi:MAG: beta-propeller domain-containing protein, methanol dehydrogenase [Cyanobacteria bacterium SW_9_44_58]|nr:MAG: beta-propeller domain-containing protein, methanol dehydrogenase [Cyanobacteria bacterium SW_9_44_58]
MSQFLQQIATKLKFYKKQLLLILIPCFFFSMTALPVYAATSPSDVPDIGEDNTSWVVDQAEVISPINEGKLNDVLKDVADTTGAEMKFVVIRRLNYGETVDSFADNLFKQWYPNPEQRQDKVLLVFDTITNNVALRVGEQLKDRLSEDIAQSVIQDTIGVPIREDNKYNEAFLNASNRLGTVLAGEPDPGPPQVQDDIQVESTFTKAEETDTENSTVWVVGLLVVATIIPMATYFAYVLLTN